MLIQYAFLHLPDVDKIIYILFPYGIKGGGSQTWLTQDICHLINNNQC